MNADASFLPLRRGGRFLAEMAPKEGQALGISDCDHSCVL